MLGLTPFICRCVEQALAGLLQTLRMALIRISKSDKLSKKLPHMNLEALHLAVKSVEAYAR
jgi:hypothetical protein